MKHPLRSLALPALAILAVSPVVAAEDSDMEELKAMVKSMQQTIADQNARIASLEGRQQERSKPDPAVRKASGGAAEAPPKPAAAAASKPDPKAPSTLPEPPALKLKKHPDDVLRVKGSTVRDADTFADLQQAAPRADNAALDPALKGFIAIPGTETLFKIGGSARVDTIIDFGNNGSPNQFIPSSIPVEGQAGHDGGERATIHGKATRLSLELRRAAGDDSSLRIYNENDFFDDSGASAMKFRVRHFYGQAWNILIGQTYTTFMDIDVFPDVVDYEGPNGIVNRRQTQIRYTHPVYDDIGKVQLFGSIEQPDSQIDTETGEFEPGATSLSKMPDGVFGARWEGGLGHLQATSIFRELSYETDDGPDQNTLGWGISLSGALTICEKDKLAAQITYGEGIARYINDLGGLDSDAALDNGRFDAIPVFAAMVGYTHLWNDHWRTTVSGGYAELDAPGALGAYAIDSTLYGSANLMWHPSTSFRMGLEYLYGRKETQNGSSENGSRLNFVIRHDLVR